MKFGGYYWLQVLDIQTCSGCQGSSIDYHLHALSKLFFPPPHLSSGAHVKKIDFGHLAGGVLHSKFWIVDMKHIYIGSANMDWRSLSQVSSAAAYSKIWEKIHVLAHNREES